MTTYEKLLCAAAEYEVEQLKKSGKKFILNKATFNPEASNCMYAQTFGSWSGEKAKEFKKKNNILVGFYPESVSTGIDCSALERFMLILWANDKKEQVYKIIEQFATWKSDTVLAEENLYTL